MKNLLAAATCILLASPALAADCPAGSVRFGGACVNPSAARCATGTYMLGGACVKPTAEQGLALLLEGNARFVRGNLRSLGAYSKPVVRTELGLGQKPFAIVLTCSDSRLPPEILFDRGLGEIFVVRVAGNIVAPHELGSIEYGLEHLGANLVVVLGHERCGAVKATYDAFPTPVEGNIGSLVEAIAPAVAAVVGPAGENKATDAAGKAVQVEQCVVENIRLVGESLLTRSPIIEHLVSLGETRIVQAKYDLDTGKVSVLP